MDSIKHEFIGSVRPYRDRPEISVPVQWYRANPRAKFVDCPTAFANVNLFDRKFVPNVGMEFDFHPNSVGNITGADGTARCGTADSFLHGVFFGGDYSPCKCQGEDMVPIQEIPAGLIDGTNRRFSTSQMPLSNPSLLLFLDGVAQTQGVNYSLVGQIITFAVDSVPRDGNTLLCQYWVPT